MFKNLALYLIKDTLLNILKGLGPLLMLILAIWLITGAILLPGCTAQHYSLEPAPDYYLALMKEGK